MSSVGDMIDPTVEGHTDYGKKIDQRLEVENDINFDCFPMGFAVSPWVLFPHFSVGLPQGPLLPHFGARAEVQVVDKKAKRTGKLKGTSTGQVLQ